MTTAGYLRPSGKNIHRGQQATESDDWGVSPDSGFEVKFSEDELRKLVEQFDQRDALLDPSAKTPEEGTPPPAEAEGGEDTIVADRQLEKSLDYLRQRLQAAANSETSKPADAAAGKR